MPVLTAYLFDPEVISEQFGNGFAFRGEIDGASRRRRNWLAHINAQFLVEGGRVVFNRVGHRTRNITAVPVGAANVLPARNTRTCKGRTERIRPVVAPLPLVHFR